jgi:hypothetical protein
VSQALAIKLALTGCSTLSLAGYGTLIRAYVQFLLSKLRFHRHHTDFNGLFEYEEYVSLRGIDDPNEGCVLVCSLLDR